MMAAAKSEFTPSRKPIRRKRIKPHLVVVHGDRELPREEGNALLLGISERCHARRLQRRLERTVERHKDAPERQSVAIAMLAVEEQIVKALWTIARQPLGRTAPGMLRQCGVGYVHDRDDIHSIYSDAAGGKWDSIAPRPALPSAKDITAADKVQEWLLLVSDERLRKLLVVGATNKRGDAGRQIQWERVRVHLPEWGGYTLRSLKGGYQEALRIIVAELTVARVG
jgi:hypothetical protein